MDRSRDPGGHRFRHGLVLIGPHRQGGSDYSASYVGGKIIWNGLSTARRPSATCSVNSWAAAERAIPSSVCPPTPPPSGSPGRVGLCVPARCWRCGPSKYTFSCGFLPCPAETPRAVPRGVGGRRRGSSCRLFSRRWTLLARRVRSLRSPARGESPSRNHAPPPLTTLSPTSPKRCTALNPLDSARPRP